MSQIIYNPQRDNPAVTVPEKIKIKDPKTGKISEKTQKIKIHNYQQCFVSSVYMYLSYYLDKSPDTKTFEKEYLQNINSLKFIEKLTADGYLKNNAYNEWLNYPGNKAYLWGSNYAMIRSILQDEHEEVKYSLGLTLDEIVTKKKEDAPAIISTNKLGGLSGGHVIIFQKIAGDKAICFDPYGDATTNYKNHNGDGVEYPLELLNKYSSGGRGYFRCII